MSKLVVIPDSKDMLNNLLDKDINGFILSIKDLSVNSNYYITINELKKIIPIIKSNNKKIYISLNKNMFNKDLIYLEEILKELNKLDIDKIMFYDLSVINICNRLNIKKELVIYQDHLNLSINSHMFYKKRNIFSSFISSDITYKEVNDIKDNTNMTLFLMVYGYIPMSNSKRSLVTNYLKYINKEDKLNDKYYYLKEENSDNYYLIKEDEDGTTVYTKDKINLINEIDKIDNIDYYVINALNSNMEEINNIINKFNNKVKDNEEHEIYFFEKETIYKVKRND